MKALTESFLSVPYALRPCKQVERRMLLDALLLLTECGFPVRDYSYLGMGSIHFVDFAMFHKYLGIDSMLSVELSSKIEKRVRFNVPYRHAIAVETGKAIGDMIAAIPPDRRHVLWLDYDNVLSEYMLKDLSLAATRLCPGSILLVTVDTEPPGTGQVGRHISKQHYDAALVRKYFEDMAGNYVVPNNGDADFEYDKLHYVNSRVISRAIGAGELGRGHEEAIFRPLFNFEYADGHRMLTIGGLIATAKDYGVVLASRLGRASYVRTDLGKPPCRLRVPCITRREQLYLDENMPRTGDWVPEDFELSRKEVEDYSLIYRFCPTYAELYM